MNEKWDLRFLELADYVSKWSKDPSTKVGSVIVRPDKTVAGIGYNGFPRGIADASDRLAERDIKYRLMVHAEMNAILNTNEPVKGYTLYCSPLPPCERCAVHIIQAGIPRVVARANGNPRWIEAVSLTEKLFKEAGICLSLY